MDYFFVEKFIGEPLRELYDRAPPDGRSSSHLFLRGVGL